MYKTLRNIHLALGLAIIPFLFIYAFSALVFSLPFMIDKTVSKSVETHEISGFPYNINKLMAMLENEYDIRGELRKNQINDNGNVELLISKLGTYYEVSIDSQKMLLNINKNTQSIERFINSLHTSSGFDSKSPVEKWWGFAVILVAIMLVGIVVTGVALWTYNRKERRSGLIFLGFSLVYCTTVLVVLRFG